MGDVATIPLFFFGTPVEHPERGPGSTGQADYADYAGFFVLLLH